MSKRIIYVKSSENTLVSKNVLVNDGLVYVITLNTAARTYRVEALDENGKLSAFAEGSSKGLARLKLKAKAALVSLSGITFEVETRPGRQRSTAIKKIANVLAEGAASGSELTTEQVALTEDLGVKLTPTQERVQAAFEKSKNVADWG